MNASASAREAARRGHVGGLAAGSGSSSAWVRASSHADALGAQGADVSINDGWKTIEIYDAERQWLYPDGTPKLIRHYTNGKLQDPDDGTPAWQWLYPDGTPRLTIHYTNGLLVSETTFPPPIGEA